MSLPKYIAARHIALALGPEWRTQRVARILMSMGCGRRLGNARGVWTTPEDLAGCWPDMYEEILAKIEIVKPVKERRRQPISRKKDTNNQAVSKQTRVKFDTTVCEHVWSTVTGKCGHCNADRPNLV